MEDEREREKHREKNEREREKSDLGWDDAGVQGIVDFSRGWQDLSA